MKSKAELRYNIVNNYMQVSQIELSQIERSDPQCQELLLSKTQLNTYKQQFDKESFEKKKAYLEAVQSQNKELLAKIKELDKKLNAQIDILSKKIVSPSKKRSVIPKTQEFQTTQLKNKFKELQKIKRELDHKRTGVNSLDFLLSIRQKYKIQLNQLNRQILAKKQQLAAFKKMKEKSTAKDQAIQNQVAKMGEFNIYDNEIDLLRRKVLQKSQQVKNKKEQFFKLYNKNRSNKSMIAQPGPIKETQLQQDAQLLGLRQRYFQMSKKIESLKSKKMVLLRNKVDCSEQMKALQKLKQKLQNISKLTNK